MSKVEKAYFSGDFDSFKIELSDSHDSHCLEGAMQILSRFIEESTQPHNLMTHGPMPLDVNAAKIVSIVDFLLLPGAGFNFNVVSGDIHIKFNKKIQISSFNESIEAGESINLTKIIKSANLAHLELDEKMHANYQEFIKTKSRWKPKDASGNALDSLERLREMDASNRFFALELSEMAALNIYTQRKYMYVNGLLRGDYEPKSRMQLVETLFTMAFANTGLYKVNSENRKVFRGERAWSTEVIQRRVEHSSRGGVTHEPGFISTALERPNIRFRGDIAVALHNVYGADISEISCYPREREFLIPPGTKLKWEHHYREDGSEYFIARNASYPSILAATAIDERFNPLLKEIYDFCTKYLERALVRNISQGIDVDYSLNSLSEHLKSINNVLRRIRLDFGKLHDDTTFGGRLTSVEACTLISNIIKDYINEISTNENIVDKEVLILSLSKITRTSLRDLQALVEEKVVPDYPEVEDCFEDIVKPTCESKSKIINQFGSDNVDKENENANINASNINQSAPLSNRSNLI